MRNYKELEIVGSPFIDYVRNKSDYLTSNEIDFSRIKTTKSPLNKKQKKSRVKSKLARKARKR